METILQEDKPTRKVWSIRTKGKLSIKISLHGEGEEHTPQKKGIFCYYIYIYEKLITEKQFGELWLKGERIKIYKDCPERIHHNYNKLPILDEVDFAGGITFYAKHGQEIGHRSVQLGCDYNHLWDQETPPSFNMVLRKALETANQIEQYLKQ